MCNYIITNIKKLTGRFLHKFSFENFDLKTPVLPLIPAKVKSPKNFIFGEPHIKPSGMKRTPNCDW